MRLRSLYVKGFKSFANETVLHFNEKVIGVVGPNGAGKSNVVDAIRWVLGEQKSKELRLEAMSDVIFNGTKKRKEANSATVQLIFDNDKNILPIEYQTVSISRTLYRSGESEYRLNNVICRLKDIKSLLIDTGIGSNSYAIIALGMVDDILEDKDDARRRMFEQAAGVSKYKARKRETISKLNSTEVDLDRVEDLVFEIEGNMKSLEKQAKRTKKYFEYKDEYKVLALNNAIRSIQNLKDKYKALDSHIKLKLTEYNTLQVSIVELEALLQNEKKQILDKELTLSAKQKELGHIVGNIRSNENQKNLTSQSIDFKKQSLKNIEVLLKELSISNIQIQKEIDSLDIRLKEEEIQNSKIQEDYLLKKSGLADIREKHTKIKSELDTKTSTIAKIQNEIFNVEKNLAVKSNSINTLNNDIQYIDSQLNVIHNDNERFVFQKSELEHTINQKSEALQTLKNNEDNRKEKINQLDSERDATQELLIKTNRSIDSKQNEYDLIKSMIDSFEGFPESIKFLSTQWRKDIPILSDILEVEESYRAIIEQYLDQYLNYYLVANIKEAIEAIKLLSGAQKGKANFFLLDKTPILSESSISYPLAKLAIDVVKVDQKYDALLKHLFANVYIYDGSIDDLSNNLDLEGKILLSKSGVFHTSSVSISGGAVGLFEGKKIGRKKNLEALEKSLIVLKDDRNKFTKILEEVRNLKHELTRNDFATSIERTANEINAFKQQLAKISAQLETASTQKKEKETLLESNKAKINALNTEIEGLDVAKLDFIAQISSIELSFGSNANSIDDLTASLSSASELFNESNIRYIKHSNLCENLKNELNSKLSRLTEVNQKAILEHNKSKSEEENYLQLNNKLVFIENELARFYKEKSNFQGSLSEVERDYYKTREKLAEQEEKSKSIIRNSNLMQVEINKMKEEFSEVKYEITAVGDRLNIEFGVPINDIINSKPNNEIDIEVEQEKITALKIKIQNFGEINPLALEAYDEIRVRYDVIIQQRADIQAAKISLMKTISEIESTATKQFMNSFESIRLNFIEVFRSLFTDDDTCDLILLDETNPLDSHIEILAKPKGKKPKSLSQLSGGEKTLTATALLFALYLLKPAPFCIFDEVDAPLDDANIMKFNKIINKFSDRSQFIIITHNKATMASVDTLYGVYMQEVGISAVTPVDFRKYQDTGLFETIEQN